MLHESNKTEVDNVAKKVRLCLGSGFGFGLWLGLVENAFNLPIRQKEGKQVLYIT